MVAKGSMIRKGDTDLIISIVVVDDDPRVLTSLMEYFDLANDIEVIGTARDGAEALTVIDKTRPTMVLADIHMPGMDGLTLLTEIALRPNRPVFLAMTGFDSDNSMFEVLSRGGVGYILKSARPEEIIESVRSAAKGEPAVSPEALPRLTGFIARRYTRKNESLQVYGSLSRGERLVLQGVCEGRSNAEISRVTTYSEGTVKRYLSNLISVFGARSRTDLAVKVVRLGLMESDL